MRRFPYPAALAVALAALPSPAASAEDGGFVSEIRLGVLVHDAAIITQRVEPRGADGNFEILFDSPGLLRAVWSPRPHIGATGNPDGATSQAYLGLTWDWALADRVFAEAGAGAGIHNGKIGRRTAGPEEKPLGCRVLFRGSLSLGLRLTARHSISIMADHSSNGYLCGVNPGLDTVGVRYGYRF